MSSVERDLPRTPTRRNPDPGSVRWHVLVIGGAWGVIAVVVAIAAASGVRMTRLTKDTLQHFDSDRFYLGLLSHVGGLLWCAGAVVTLFTATLTARAEARSFLVGLGVVTAALMADDVFMLHELVGPVWLGVPEVAFYAVYMLATAAVLLMHRRYVLASTPWGVLVLALGLLGAAEVLDLLTIGNIGTDVEDGFKLAGIVAWCRYCWSTARAAVS